MYKLAMPISMGTVTDESLPIYAKQARQCGADRIFLGGMGLIYSKLGRIGVRFPCFCPLHLKEYGEYSSIRFVGCEGELRADKVFLRDIPPYGFAAFEVTK